MRRPARAFAQRAGVAPLGRRVEHFERELRAGPAVDHGQEPPARRAQLEHASRPERLVTLLAKAHCSQLGRAAVLGGHDAAQD